GLGVGVWGEISDSPEGGGIMDRFLSHGGEEDLLSQLAKRKTANGQPFAGTQACMTCNPESHKVWAASPHSHAWQTLINVKHDRDPDCVVCHVVGLEYETGFKSAGETPNLVNVGCENCHGPQGKHAKNPAAI